MSAEIAEPLQEVLGHRFTDLSILIQALTHSSFSHEIASRHGAEASTGDNERLEFLGDAVLGLVIAQELMVLFPGACEGKLSQWRSSLVSRRTLAALGRELDLGRFLLLGKGERRSGGATKPSILAAAMEAVVGALYLDGGLEAAKHFVCRAYQTLLDGLSRGNGYVPSMVDNKTYLQERTQDRYRCTPIYRLVETWGLEHQKHFRVELVIDGRVVAVGDGKSKKEAEQAAASEALRALEF